jgi:hypothetical protein
MRHEWRSARDVRRIRISELRGASRFLTMVGGTTAAAVALSTTFVLRGKVGTVSANRAHSVRRLSLLKHPEKWRSVDGISIAFEFISDRDAEIALGRRGRNEAWRNSPLSGGVAS